MSYFFPGSLGLSEQPASPAQVHPIDGTPTLLPAGVMYSTLLHAHARGDRKFRTQNPQAAGSTSPERLRSFTAPDWAT